MAKSARATYAAATTAAPTASGGNDLAAGAGGERSAFGGVAQRFAQNVDKTTVRGLFAARAAERHVWVVQSPAPRGPT